MGALDHGIDLIDPCHKKTGNLCLESWPSHPQETVTWLSPSAPQATHPESRGLTVNLFQTGPERVGGP